MARHALARYVAAASSTIILLHTRWANGQRVQSELWLGQVYSGLPTIVRHLLNHIGLITCHLATSIEKNAPKGSSFGLRLDYVIPRKILRAIGTSPRIRSMTDW